MYTENELAKRRRDLAPILEMERKPIPVPVPKIVEDASMENLEDPKKLRTLPENYEVVFDDPKTAANMHEFARKLAAKHRNWTKERLMRKCFEEFPTTRIRIK